MIFAMTHAFFECAGAGLGYPARVLLLAGPAAVDPSRYVASCTKDDDDSA
jgi:hypothetical protein